MATATFYIVRPDSPQATAAGFEAYVVFLSQHFARQGAKVYLQCATQQHAEQIAERFWQVEAKDFLGHNLVGKGRNTAPILKLAMWG